MAIDPLLEPMAKRLKVEGVWREFSSLVRAGCDADTLLIVFGAVKPHAERDVWNQCLDLIAADYRLR